MKAYTSLNLVQQDLKNGSITCAQLVENYLSVIKDKDHLNALVEVYDQESKAAALAIDQKIANGDAGKLAGLVVTIKDVLCHKDHSLQAGSKILDGFESQFTGTAVERLLAEDAIIIGRNNCDEFAMGSSNENSSFGPVKNDVDNERVPGGSSGGSAVAVQAGMCMISIGTDTGGSVRQPAAFCGLVGLKPTYSRISRHGLTAYASSFDCIGIFGKNVEDVALVLEIISGPDQYDSTVSRKEVPAYSQLITQGTKKYKLAYIKEALESDGIEPDIKKNIDNRIDQLRNEGHIVEAIDFPLIEYLLPTYYILTTAEASSNLSRFDGVRYGFRTPNAYNLEEMYKKTRSEGFGEEVKRRIMLGTFVLSASYYDAYYTKAQKVRRIIREETKRILSNYDFLITPTTPTTAFKLGEKTKDPLTMYLEDLYTVQSSVAGLPAISVPCGVDHQNLPIGLQVMTNDFEEVKLLSFSNYLMSLN